MAPRFASASATAVPLYLIEQDQLQSWLSHQSATVQAWVTNNGFTAA